MLGKYLQQPVLLRRQLHARAIDRYRPLREIDTERTGINDWLTGGAARMAPQGGAEPPVRAAFACGGDFLGYLLKRGVLRLKRTRRIFLPHSSRKEISWKRRA